MDPTPLHPKVMTKLPDMAVYGPGVAGNVRRKTTVRVQPLSGTEFSPRSQRIIQIQLPKNGFLNGVNSYLAFNHSSINTETGAGKMATAEKNALSTSASNWIQRLRIKVGGKIVEDIDDYNVLHEILRSSVVTQQFRDSLAGQLEGYEPACVSKTIELVGSDTAGNQPTSLATLPEYYGGSSAGIRGVAVNLNRSADIARFAQTELMAPHQTQHTLQLWAQTGKDYQVILLSGLLRSAKYLPLRFMPPVEIEITLADFERSHVWAPQRDIRGLDENASRVSYFGGDNSSTTKRYLGNINGSVLANNPSLGVSSTQPFEYQAYAPCIDRDSNGTTTGRHPTAAASDTVGLASETISSDKTYKITNVNFVGEILEFDDSFYQAFEASLSQGITIPYVTYTNHVFALRSTQGDIQIAERVRSARSLLAVMRNNKDLAWAPYPKFLFTRQGLKEFQIKIGTQYFPLQPIEVDVDPYSGERLIELQKVISSMADVSHGMTTSVADINTKFIIGMDLQREFDRLSGLDTTKGLPLFLSMKGASCDATLNIFVSYDMFVDLFPGEVVEVLN